VSSCLRVAIMTWATLVNTQAHRRTHRQTVFVRL